MEGSFFGRRGVPWVLLACSVILNVVLFATRTKAPDHPTASNAAKPAATAAATPATPPTGPRIEWQQATTAVTGTLERSFTQLLGDELGPQVSQTYARLFVWDVNFRTDLSPKDRIEVLYRELGNAEIDIAAARLQVQKKGKMFRAYKFTNPGDKQPSWWNEEGTEVSHQLKDSPIRDYTQITSLVGDGRGHAGMDFKTPVGTPVMAPQAGKVLRTNWNWNANGNCIEIEYADGTLAKFLHLSENKVKPGDAVEPGQQIAMSGNTGHSTAPHLHYQLNQGAKVIDPVAYHGTVRRSLDPKGLTAFKAAVAGFDQAFAPKTAGL